MMSPATRTRYHAELWPAACAVKGWRAADQEKRRAVALDCMAKVRGPLVSTSDTLWQDDETTALFAYLEHMAAPASLEKSQRWVDCQQDYRAFNRARQADWHQAKAYGQGKANRLDQNRFGGASSAQGAPQEAFDPEAIKKRFLTTRSRHVQRKGYVAPAKPSAAKGQGAAGTNLASQVPAGVTEEDPF